MKFDKIDLIAAIIIIILIQMCYFFEFYPTPRFTHSKLEEEGLEIGR